MLAHDVQLDADYIQWLVELKSRYRSAQIKAAVRVNAEKLMFNWQLGRDIVLKKPKADGAQVLLNSFRLTFAMSFPKTKDSLLATSGI